MFNIRDLMVNLTAHAAGGAAQPFIFCAATCDFSGCFVCTGTCFDTRVGCGGTYCLRSFGCGISTVIQVAGAPDATTASQQLTALKDQLKQALAEIEKQEQALEKK